MKVCWNKWGLPYWGYSYIAGLDYEHEICLYRLCICWRGKEK